MSLHEYLESQEITRVQYPFYSLVMATMRQADTSNLEKLKRAFPEQWHEMKARCLAPGGRLPHEE
jgi:hypothetical protein